MPELPDEIDAFYHAYHQCYGFDRNSIVHNPGARFQYLAGEEALLRALARIELREGRILDVGGGSGGSLVTFLATGIPCTNLASVDIRPAESARGKERFPGIDFRTADARDLPFPDKSFEVAYSSTMFGLITDDAIAEAIAKEMRRVCSKYILIRDWNLAKDRTMKAVTPKRIRSLFGRDPMFEERGSLAPPVGRPLGNWAPWAYFGVQRAIPFLAALRVYVIEV
jgi:hypothetical protein